MTEIRTLAQFMADDAARAPQEEPLDIPPNEMERIVHQMLTREYTKTLDEAVPALGHKTPRALARTKAGRPKVADRSEEHTSELQSLMRLSYAVLCLQNTKQKQQHN